MLKKHYEPTPHRAVIAAFGGALPLSRILGLPQQTVQSWQTTGLIPSKYQQTILDAAERLGVQLSAASFFRQSKLAEVEQV